MPSRFQSPFNRKSREEAFWDWFVANSEKLKEAETGQEGILQSLYTQLGKVEKGLTFELGPASDDLREFIVSADGIRKRFPAVQKLVAAAPELPDWKIIAFRQPKGLKGKVQFGDVELSMEDIWFSVYAEGNLTGLKIYIHRLNDQNRRALAEASFILLDSVLGEYALETRIGRIDWESLPPDPEGQRLKPLKDLPGAIAPGGEKDEDQS